MLVDLSSAGAEPGPPMARLERSRALIESRFLHAGEVLGLAVQGMGQLIGSLDRLSATLDVQTVSATTSELEGSAQTLLGLPERHGQRRERLRGLQRLSAGLRGEIEEMRRHLAYLRVFAINIKVTAAGVAGAGDDFGLFAQEISDRIEAGRVELEGFAADAVALDGQLAAAMEHEQTLAGACARLIPAVPDGLAAGAHEMAAHHVKVSQVAAEVAELARQIQRKVGAALAALQVGDSTRQRIEHVQNGLDLSRQAKLHGRAGDAVQRLLSAQLAAAAADFHRDSAQIHHSMAGIAGDAKEILRLRDLAFGLSSGGESFLSRMTAYLGQALELVSSMEQAEGAAEQTGRAAAAAAEALQLRIAALQAIKTDVQQMALNTTLKCARIGDLGKPLAVIAVELRAHAGHLESSGQATLASLQELNRAAGDLVREAADAGVSEGLTAATQRVRSASETVEADLADLARQGEAVVGALSEAAHQLDFQRDIGGALEAAAAALAPDERDFDGEIGGDLGEAAAAVAEVLAAIAKTYTMAQEREVHAALTAGLQIEAPAPVVVAAGGAREAVLF
jgi:hypothetical protein